MLNFTTVTDKNTSLGGQWEVKTRSRFSCYLNDDDATNKNSATTMNCDIGFFSKILWMF